MISFNVVGKRSNIERTNYLSYESCQQCIYCLFIISYSCIKKRNVQRIQLCVKNATKTEFHEQRYNYIRLWCGLFSFQSNSSNSRAALYPRYLRQTKERHLHHLIVVTRTQKFFTHEVSGNLLVALNSYLKLSHLFPRISARALIQNLG